MLDRKPCQLRQCLLMHLNNWVILAAALLELLVIARYIGSSRQSVPIIRPRRSATGRHAMVRAEKRISAGARSRCDRGEDGARDQRLKKLRPHSC
jgi:hypothetical protein